MPQKRRTFRRVCSGVGVFISVVFLAAICFFGWVGWNTHGYFQRYVQQARDAGYREHQLTVRAGTVINYAEFVNDKTPLLLIPGQGSTWQDYAPVLPALAEDFHVVAVDVHGHGKSSWNRNDYTAVGIAEDLVVLGREVFHEKFIVAGHSSGGLIATQMAAAAPGDVLALMIEDAPFFATEADRVPGTFAGQDIDLLEAFLRQSNEEDFVSFVLPDSYIGSMFGGLWEPICREVVRQRREHPDVLPEIPWLGVGMNRIWESLSHPYDKWWSHAFFVSRSWHEGFDQEAALRRVQVRSLFMKASTNYGDDGVLLAALSDEDVAHVNELLVDNRIVRIDGGHDIHFEHPDWYVAQLRSLKPS